jgi:hypothetical protein
VYIYVNFSLFLVIDFADTNDIKNLTWNFDCTVFNVLAYACFI